MLCLFCQNSFIENSENDKNSKDFSFSFIFDLLELSADCQSEINSVKDSEIIELNCDQCSSLLEIGYIILEKIKILQKDLTFVREKLWNELSSSDSKNDDGTEMINIRKILVKESAVKSKLAAEKCEIILQTESQSQNTENEGGVDNFIIPDLTIPTENEDDGRNDNSINPDCPDLTIPPENENSDEILELRILPSEIIVSDNLNDDDDSNTEFTIQFYETEESECDNDNEDVDPEFKKKRKATKKSPKNSKKTIKITKSPKSLKKKNKNTDENEQLQLRRKLRKRERPKNILPEKELPKEKSKAKRAKLDTNVNVLHFCDICQIKFKNITNLNGHLKRAVHVKKVKEISGKEIERELEECPICKKYYAPSTFRDHFRTEFHQKNEAEAPEELVKLLDEKWPKLPRNVGKFRVHPLKWKFKCEICEKKFSNTFRLERHKRTRVHLQKEKELTGIDNLEAFIIKCEPCNLQFTDQVFLKRHLKRKIHLQNQNEMGKEIKTVLDKPGKKIRKKRDKSNTIVKEERPKKSTFWVCEKCGQSFTQKGSMEKHIKRKHEKIAKYFCKFCPYKNYFRHQLTDHVGRVHTKKLDWICDICGKGVPSKYSLSTHKYRYHTKHRFKCEHCPKTFQIKRHYESHVNFSHSSVEKWPFHCPEPDCGKAYIKKVNYEAHLSTHSPELKDSVKCDFCKKSFSHKIALYFHKVRTHKKEIS